MKSVITELWYGNINPQEDGIFDQPEFKELLDYTVRHYNGLVETLTDKQKEVFDKLMDNWIEFEGLAEAAVFEYDSSSVQKCCLKCTPNNSILNIDIIPNLRYNASVCEEQERNTKMPVYDQFLESLLPGNYALTKSMELTKVSDFGTLRYRKSF